MSLMQPVDNANDQSRCQLTEAGPIAQLLLEMCHRQAPLSIKLEDTEIWCASSLLAVDVEHGRLVLDASAAESINVCLERGMPVHVHSQLDRVDVRFVLPALSRCLHEQRTAFSAPLPERVMHLQRRELYRLATPLTEWPEVTLPPRAGGSTPPPLRVADIGTGGMALLHDLAEDELVVGQMINECRLQLPGGPALLVDIRVCNERPVQRQDGSCQRRTGVAFENLPASAQNHISRYIFSVERMRNARRQGQH